MRTSPTILAAVVIAAGAPLLAGAASAAPLSGPLALKGTGAVAPVENVQWRWRGGRWIGPAVGFGAGLAVGSALAAPAYAYGPGYDAYGYDEGYDEGYDDGYVAAAPGPVGGDGVAYCAQRFRSYDPASGTYLGYDGLRHPCP